MQSPKNGSNCCVLLLAFSPKATLIRLDPHPHDDCIKTSFRSWIILTMTQIQLLILSPHLTKPSPYYAFSTAHSLGFSLTSIITLLSLPLLLKLLMLQFPMAQSSVFFPFLLYIRSIPRAIQSQGFRHHLYDHESLIYVPSPDEAWISNRLFGISTWISSMSNIACPELNL